MSKQHLNLPNEIKVYKEVLAKTIKPYIKIDKILCKTDPWESKIGGYPYLKTLDNYPKDRFDKPMSLLAQINFKDLPENQIFPNSGILQFFISAYDELYGMNFDDATEQKDFRIIFHEDVTNDLDKIITDFSFLKKDLNNSSPITKEAKMIFKRALEPVSISDYQFEKYFGLPIFDFLEDFSDSSKDYFYKNCVSDGHKIGGYAHFTQYDPRDAGCDDYNILLLQLDSDNDLDLVWGDCGIANFFIRYEDLNTLNFNDVLYYWDCC